MVCKVADNDVTLRSAILTSIVFSLRALQYNQTNTREGFVASHDFTAGVSYGKYHRIPHVLQWKQVNHHHPRGACFVLASTNLTMVAFHPRKGSKGGSSAELIVKMKYASILRLFFTIAVLLYVCIIHRFIDFLPT